MPRTKGSKNKEVKKVVKKDKEDLIPSNNVPKGALCSECKHSKEMHYGGAKGHCNTGGCLCAEFK